jgi:pyrroline-5-carboxylate reductase
MSTAPPVERDERTVAVENAGYRWAFIFLYFALLIDAAYRTVFRHEAAWDLLALVFVSGTASMIHQIRQQTWTRSQTRAAVLFGLLGAVVFGVIVPIVIWLRS